MKKKGKETLRFLVVPIILWACYRSYVEDLPSWIYIEHFAFLVLNGLGFEWLEDGLYWFLGFFYRIECPTILLICRGKTGI